MRMRYAELALALCISVDVASSKPLLKSLRRGLAENDANVVKDGQMNDDGRDLAIDFDEINFWQMFYTRTIGGSMDTEPPQPNPTRSPTPAPQTSEPTRSPRTKQPTSAPVPPQVTQAPTVTESSVPTPAPQAQQTEAPSLTESSVPTPAPQVQQTPAPSTSQPLPTQSPTSPAPTRSPVPPVPGFTFSPSAMPTPNPSPTPTTSAPTESPTTQPTPLPTTTAPTRMPVPDATPAPTQSPTTQPTPLPTTKAPTRMPVPDATPDPTRFPSSSPTSAPTPLPTSSPTGAPTPKPTPGPTPTPTQIPTPVPTKNPTSNPTGNPTAAPTPVPTPAPTEPQAPVIQIRLLPYVLQGGQEFEDPESYQSKALVRTEQQVGILGMSDAKTVQYYALYCIYNSTNKVPNQITMADSRFDNIPDFPEWTIATGWEENDLDPCDGWHGIECENDRVTVVDLFQNVLTGIFPAETSLLASDGPRSTGAGALRQIDLFNNEFLFNNFGTY